MDDETLRFAVEWARQRDDVRAVLLTSTRSQPNAEIDLFSDYDLVLAVTDVGPFYSSRDWLHEFGPLLVVYRDPLRVEDGFAVFTSVTQYESAQLKIDFTVMQAGLLRQIALRPQLPPEFDDGYRVLLDKDALTEGMSAPTHRAYTVLLPNVDEYRYEIEVFLHEATYVAKNLWRGELLPAKYSFDEVMKLEYLRRMLEWRVVASRFGSDGTPFKAGLLGKRLAQHTPPELWQRLEATYVSAETAANWEALFALMALYRDVAVEVGAAVGADYPQALHDRMLAYLSGVRDLPQTGI